MFHNIDLVEYPHGPQADPGLSARVEQAAFESLMAFARTGDPANPAVPAWPASRPDAEQTLILDAAPRVRVNYDHALIRALAVETRKRLAEGRLFDPEEIQH